MPLLVFWPHAGAWGAGVILPPCAALSFCGVSCKQVVCYEEHTKIYTYIYIYITPIPSKPFCQSTNKTHRFTVLAENIFIFGNRAMATRSIQELA